MQYKWYKFTNDCEFCIWKKENHQNERWFLHYLVLKMSKLAHLSHESAHLSPESAYLSPELAHWSLESAHWSPELAHLSPELAYSSHESAHLSPESAHLSPHLEFNSFTFAVHFRHGGAFVALLKYFLIDFSCIWIDYYYCRTLLLKG